LRELVANNNTRKQQKRTGGLYKCSATSSSTFPFGAQHAYLYSGRRGNGNNVQLVLDVPDHFTCTRSGRFRRYYVRMAGFESKRLLLAIPNVKLGHLCGRLPNEVARICAYCCPAAGPATVCEMPQQTSVRMEHGSAHLAHAVQVREEPLLHALLVFRPLVREQCLGVCENAISSITTVTTMAHNGACSRNFTCSCRHISNTGAQSLGCSDRSLAIHETSQHLRPLRPRVHQRDPRARVALGIRHHAAARNGTSHSTQVFQ
jgi:hypothetical protein